MEINQIRAFLAVADELHFGRAAESLGIAQPPLSRTIRQLETELGTTLFHRTTRSVSLTPTGYALVEPARAVLASARTAEESIRLASAGEIGHVTLGFSGASSNRLVARLTREALRRQPGLTLHLESTTFADEGLTRLLDGSLDLALVRWRAAPPGITGRAVMVERPIVALSSEHRLAGRTSVSMDDLRDEDFVMLPERPASHVRERAVQWCLEAGFTPRVVQTAPDSLTIGALVAAGIGLTITYDSVTSAITDPDIVTIPLDVRDAHIPVYLAHRTDAVSPALAQVLAAAEDALPTVSSGA